MGLEVIGTAQKSICTAMGVKQFETQARPYVEMSGQEMLKF